MLSSSKLLLSTCLLSLSTTLASASCTGVVGIIASAIAGDAAAGSFCSSKFPQPAKSVTLTASTVTVTSSTDTITVTVTSAQQERKRAPRTTTTTSSSIKASSTTKSAATTKPATTTSSKSVPPTTTAGSSSKTSGTVTGCSGNAKSCALSTLLSTAQSVASAICGCIEIPQTSTITPAVVTVTTDTTTTTTRTVPPQGTACDYAQVVECDRYPSDGECTCAVGVESGVAYCYYTYDCIGCSTDLNCNAGEVCAYDYTNFCGQYGFSTGGKICISRGGEACGNAIPPQ